MASADAFRGWYAKAEGQDPWRLHWPESRDDDRIMTDFLTIMSMRYTTWTAVNACKMHVIEFHRAFLAVCPPPFPMADWLLAKLKKTMAQEKPEGRRMRPVGGGCKQLWRVGAEIPGTARVYEGFRRVSTVRF